MSEGVGLNPVAVCPGYAVDHCPRNVASQVANLLQHFRYKTSYAPKKIQVSVGFLSDVLVLCYLKIFFSQNEL